MSPHFGKCPCPDNLIQIKSGPSLENLIKEIRYTNFHLANPGQVLKQSMQNNTFNGVPLGGNMTLMSHGYDNPTVAGFLPDIHPCSDSTEEKQCSSAPPPKNIVENFKTEEASNENLLNDCYIIASLILLALIIAIVCKVA